MENIFLLNKAVWRQLTSPISPAKEIYISLITSLGYQKKNSIRVSFRTRCYRPLQFPAKVLVRRVSTVNLCFKQSNHNKIDPELSLNKGNLLFYKKFAQIVPELQILCSHYGQRWLYGSSLEQQCKEAAYVLLWENLQGRTGITNSLLWADS